MRTMPVFLPGKFHEQRSLVGYSPWGHRVRHDRAPIKQHSQFSVVGTWISIRTVLSLRISEFEKIRQHQPHLFHADSLSSESPEKPFLNKYKVNVRFSGGSVLKILPAKAGDVSSIPGLGRSRGGGNRHPCQYYWLENSIDRGAWCAIVHGFQRVRHD